MKVFPALVATFLVALCNFSHLAECLQVKFTKVDCVTYNKSKATFKYCYLKTLSRHRTSANVHLELPTAPISNITLNAQFMRKGSRDNVYRLFMYNSTMDFCQFLKRPSRYMFWKIVFGEMNKFANLNNSCPVYHDVIVDGFILTLDAFALVPFPADDYLFQLRFAHEYKDVFQIRSYMSIYN